MRALILAAAVVGMLGGCARASSPRAAPRGDRNALTQAQLAATDSHNLYDAIAKLRPDWLSSRGPMSVTDPRPAVASVFLDGTLLGRAGELRQVRVLDVTAVRYWDAGRASARFGVGHPRGVIELTRR